jgi:hypothetical protein
MKNFLREFKGGSGGDVNGCEIEDIRDRWIEA